MAPSITLSFFFTYFLAIFLVRVAYIDAKRLIIPNTDSLMLLLAGGVFCALVMPEELLFRGFMSLMFFAVGALLSVGAGFVFRKATLGMGDVKLFAASTLWVGPHNMAWLLMISAGSALAMIALEFQRSDIHIPFGPYLCMGIALLWGLELWRMFT